MFRYCILSNTFASSVCLNFTLMVNGYAFAIQEQPLDVTISVMSLHPALRWCHLATERHQNMTVQCPNVLFSAERPRRSPSIFCCPLVAAIPPVFFLVLLLQQITIRLQQNRMHVCPDNLLGIYFTLFRFSNAKRHSVVIWSKNSANTALLFVGVKRRPRL